MSDRRLDYLTEKELEQLISDVEDTQLLQAPSYLKRELWQKIHRPYQPIVPEQKKYRNRIVLYRIKVGMAVAAALILLCILPVERMEKSLDSGRCSEERTGYEWQSDGANGGSGYVAKQLQESTDQICQTLQELSGWLVAGDF